MKIQRSIAILLALIIVISIGKSAEAYFPYDPCTGGFEFSRTLSNQHLDSWLKIDGRWQKAKFYVTDLSHITQRYGLMVLISDPDATITVKRLKQGHLEPKVELEVLEVTSSYKIVDVMDPTLEKISITVTSPHPARRFSIIIMAICE